LSSENAEEEEEEEEEPIIKSNLTNTINQSDQ